jgi:hypothetical protein
MHICAKNMGLLTTLDYDFIKTDEQVIKKYQQLQDKYNDHLNFGFIISKFSIS